MDTLKQVSRGIKETNRTTTHAINRVSENLPVVDRAADFVNADFPFEMGFNTYGKDNQVLMDLHIKDRVIGLPVPCVTCTQAEGCPDDICLHDNCFLAAEWTGETQNGCSIAFVSGETITLKAYSNRLGGGPTNVFTNEPSNHTGNILLKSRFKFDKDVPLPVGHGGENSMTLGYGYNVSAPQTLVSISVSQTQELFIRAGTELSVSVGQFVSNAYYLVECDLTDLKARIWKETDPQPDWQSISGGSFDVASHQMLVTASYWGNINNPCATGDFIQANIDYVCIVDNTCDNIQYDDFSRNVAADELGYTLLGDYWFVDAPDGNQVYADGSHAVLLDDNDGTTYASVSANCPVTSEEGFTVRTTFSCDNIDDFDYAFRVRGGDTVDGFPGFYMELLLTTEDYISVGLNTFNVRFKTQHEGPSTFANLALTQDAVYDIEITYSSTLATVLINGALLLTHNTTLDRTYSSQHAVEMKTSAFAIHTTTTFVVSVDYIDFYYPSRPCVPGALCFHPLLHTVFQDTFSDRTTTAGLSNVTDGDPSRYEVDCGWWQTYDDHLTKVQNNRFEIIGFNNWNTIEPRFSSGIPYCILWLIDLSETTAGSSFYVGTAYNEDSGPDMDWLFMSTHPTAGRVEIRRETSVGFPVETEYDIIFPPGRYWVKQMILVNSHYASIWPVGSPEPSTWMFENHTFTPLLRPLNYIGLFMNANGGKAYVEQVTIQTALGNTFPNVNYLVESETGSAGSSWRWTPNFNNLRWTPNPSSPGPVWGIHLDWADWTSPPASGTATVNTVSQVGFAVRDHNYISIKDPMGYDPTSVSMTITGKVRIIYESFSTEWISGQWPIEFWKGGSQRNSPDNWPDPYIPTDGESITTIIYNGGSGGVVGVDGDGYQDFSFTITPKNGYFIWGVGYPGDPEDFLFLGPWGNQFFVIGPDRDLIIDVNEVVCSLNVTFAGACSTGSSQYSPPPPVNNPTP